MALQQNSPEVGAAGERQGNPQWWITTGPFTDPLCQKVAGPFASQEEAIENRARIEQYTGAITFWVDSPERAAERSTAVVGSES